MKDYKIKKEILPNGDEKVSVIYETPVKKERKVILKSSNTQ